VAITGITNTVVQSVSQHLHIQTVFLYVASVNWMRRRFGRFG